MKKNSLYLMIITLLFLNLYTLVQYNMLKKQIDNNIRQSDYEHNNLRNEMNNIFSKVDAKIKNQGSILESYNVTFGQLNSSNLTVPIIISITPKEYTKTLKAGVVFNNKTIPMQSDGMSFKSTIDVQVFENALFKVVLEDNGIQKIETLEEYTDLKEKYLLSLYVGFSGSSGYRTDKNLHEFEGQINIDFNHSEDNGPIKITLVKEFNGNVIGKQEVEPSRQVTIPIRDKVTINKGDKFIIYALVEDFYNLSYKYIISTYEIDSNGNPTEVPLYMDRLVEIKDKYGKVLYTPKEDFMK